MTEQTEVYTIVITGADTDRGCFPDPCATGSYLSLSCASAAFSHLVEEKKRTLDGRYDKEERDDYHWEMYQDGYGAACFLRIDIIPSELCFAP